MNPNNSEKTRVTKCTDWSIPPAMNRCSVNYCSCERKRNNRPLPPPPPPFTLELALVPNGQEFQDEVVLQVSINLQNGEVLVDKWQRMQRRQQNNQQSSDDQQAMIISKTAAIRKAMAIRRQWQSARRRKTKWRQQAAG